MGKEEKREGYNPSPKESNPPERPTPPPPMKYEKPLLEEHERKFFTEEIWDKFNGGKGCQQCSGCHGCR